MKNIFKFFGTAIIMFAFTVSTYGQITDSDVATATATIVGPISIAKTVDMNFGFVASSGALGTVILATDGSRGFTGGVTLLAGGIPAAASFTVTGNPGAAFTFSVPGSITLASGGNSMTVDTFVDDAPANIPVGGTVTVLLGATLDVDVNQPAGTYTNIVDLIATVNYN